jgi:uncharacterized protein
VRLFVDTSALFIALDRSNRDFERARDRLRLAHEREENLVSHNYVVSEACAVAQRRLGAESAVELLHRIVPLLDLVWIDRSIHDSAVASFVSRASRSISLVDQVSFEVMRRERIRTAFAFDDDFVKAGFEVVP